MLIRQEKHEKGEDIEEVKEGARIKSAQARKDFQNHFSRSLFWKKKNLDML